MPVDDDRFRKPGSPYARDEPIAVAVVQKGQEIDWSTESKTPHKTLWMPETLFDQVMTTARILGSDVLGGIDTYTQTRLNAPAVEMLERDLRQVEAFSQNAIIKEALTLMLGVVAEYNGSGEPVELLIEGP